MSQECIFCKIIAKKISATIILETKNVLVINDINPKAPIHCLIIPKCHIINISNATEHNWPLIHDSVQVIQKVAQHFDCFDFNVITNNGSQAGQTVPHLHWHFLSGINIYKDNGIKL